ncbi:HAD hydrolase-like protein [Acidianus sulfidivorans JP7]|uniref:2-haloalkanoic acid dehalogenase n=1 Tax=Acidianus sulfidivorans JP7 TaxID=619593 RepID=A0A2U9IKK5_9CREN|nr:HAD family hydrolase [Acidianus sulfidivorans]AWR96559.1 HAD hydrolase-like protein [Acidianus sulfidivorans JP7]
MAKAIFIDMGETLVKFIPRYDEAVAKAIREEGIEVDDKLVFRALMSQMGNNHFPHRNLGGLSNIDFRDLFYRLGKYVEPTIIRRLESKSYLSEKYELYDDAIPFLEEMKNLGLKIILVSNATSKIHEIVRELNLINYLDGIVASCDLGIMKPHPKIFYYARKISNAEGIHIGDVYEIDYIGAKRAYLDAILLDRFGFYPEVKDNKVVNLFEAAKLIKDRLGVK